MTKEEIIKRTLNMQGAYIIDDIKCLCNAKSYNIIISNDGCPLKIMKMASGEDNEDERKLLIKCAEHLYSLNPELILWVWKNENSCLVME